MFCVSTPSVRSGGPFVCGKSAGGNSQVQKNRRSIQKSRQRIDLRGDYEWTAASAHSGRVRPTPVKMWETQKHRSDISNALRMQMDGQQIATEFLLPLSHSQDKPNHGVNPKRLELMLPPEHGTSSKQHSLSGFVQQDLKINYSTNYIQSLRDKMRPLCRMQNAFKTAAQALGKTSSGDCDAIARIWIISLHSEI